MEKQSLLERAQTPGRDLEYLILRQIDERTLGRIVHLRVEADTERVIVRGYSPSYYYKQLTLAAVQEALALASMSTMLVALDVEVGGGVVRIPEGDDWEWRHRRWGAAASRLD